MPVPEELLLRQQWLIWRFEAPEAEGKKPRKMPYYAFGGKRVGKQGDEKDRARLVSHAQASHQAQDRKLDGRGFEGMGFAFLPGDGLIGIDLDNVIDAETGEVSPLAQQIISRCASYTEYSPSRRGVHIIGRGAIERTFKSNDAGVEVFAGAQYFTWTGAQWAGAPDSVNEISAEAIAFLRQVVDDAKAQRGRRSSSAPQSTSRVPPRAEGAPHSSSDNDFRRVNDAAMGNFDAWVPVLFPAAKRTHSGYRVPSKALGRDLQEDLAIHRDGIVDYGVADQGDKREGRRSPIDLVIEYGHAGSPAEALRYLAERLGIALSPPRAPRSSRSGGGGEPPPSNEGPPPAGDDGPALPAIEWRAGELPQAVDAAEAALMGSSERVFQRGDFLVRVVRREAVSVRHYTRPPGVLGLRTIDAYYLTELFTRVAYWQRWDNRSKEFARMNAPDKVASTYLARVGRWNVPPLWSAITSPTLRPDGSVLQDPGYDPQMRVWYDPCGVEFPRVPDKPTRAQAEQALDDLECEFASFPFADALDRSVYLSLVLTGLVRRSLPSAPLGAITAPVMSSGKTLLADCIAILATGTVAPAMKYAETDEEASKTALAVLAEGDAVVLIDNIERPLQGDWLCSMLTSENYRGRMLGRTEMMTLPTNTMWLATGNHLVLAGDVRTRALMCRLDPQVERPEERQFKGDLRVQLGERRPHLVAAGLTVLRAYIASGEASPVPDWGRFEQWSRLVRSPLVWLGRRDPCECLRALEEEDPMREELGRILVAWRKVFGAEAKSVRAAIESVCDEFANEDDRALRALLLEIAKERAGTAISPKRLGTWCRNHAGRLVDGKKLVRARVKDHTAEWKVEDTAL